MGVGTGLVYLNIDLAEYIFLAHAMELEEIKICDGKSSEKLLRFEWLSLHMGRSFEEWWSTAPLELKQKARKGDEGNKPLLNQINYVLLHLHLSGKHDLKPTHEELKDWLHSGQVDVMRMEKKK
ncbi:MAG: hypothetical protein WB587_07490 [Nitrososphaeraceae archaeon]